MDLEAEQARSSWKRGLDKDASSDLVDPNLLDVLLVTHGKGVDLVTTHNSWVLPDRTTIVLGFDARHTIHRRKDLDVQTRLCNGFDKCHQDSV